MAKQTRTKYSAFTLIELLVVIAVIAMLLSVIMPSLLAAKSQAKTVVCRSNVHQLDLANSSYAFENDNFYVLAAPDMLDNGGLHRWHGTRQSLDEPFDSLKSPLADYLADGNVKQCPQKVNFLQITEWDKNFEHGCGGYGYNMTYIGSSLWRQDVSFQETYTTSTRTSRVTTPAQTLMFADSAMVTEQDKLIEYSFAEPPFTVYNGIVQQDFYMSPSIHFRHDAHAAVGWADAHVDLLKIAEFPEENAYGIPSFTMNIGWFAPLDNSLFDLD